MTLLGRGWIDLPGYGAAGGAFAAPGYWSRRITEEHRLIHKVAGEEVRIAACRYDYGC
ncbi:MULTISPECIES: type II toxin-antitoxin system YoeB family toxin [unclassified Streptomyces]|uniref:type II toxin-antitoxin system YoeB family toxin n=1 Tax=unclassified Streptomyces TaxID=2593676 RepID=UPI002E1A0BC0